MLTRRVVVSVAAGVLIAGVGVASALAEGAPPQQPVVAASAGQNGQQGTDEQGAANDIAAAANDVQSEVESDTADDQSGDDQGGQADGSSQGGQDNSDD